MDKIKPFLSGVVRHQFWILCVVLVITATVVWYMATGELDAKFTRDKNTNQSAFTAVKLKVLDQRGMNQLPNAEFAKKVEQERTALSAKVGDAWKNLFERQRKVLKVTPSLGALEPYLTDEKKWQEEIPVGMREQFHNNEIIEKEFRELFAMLDLRRHQGINPVDPLPNEPGPPEGLVVWAASPSPRDMMGRYKTQLTPSTQRIRLMYEDLWVLRSIFGMIQKINSRPLNVWLDVLEGGEMVEAAVDQANVPIKQINFCDLAQYATASITGGGGYSVGGMGGDNPDEANRLIAGRYIDGRNLPVEDPSNPPFAEFKQMFVQLSVVMDQRLVPLLIAECANADVTIETRQVLVDMSHVDDAKGASAKEAGEVVQRIEAFPNDVNVTLRGVVYGYSPPQLERLGTGSDPEPSKRDYGVPVRP